MVNNNGNNNNNQRMCLFVNIFIGILNENIHFRRTKCQPLLPYQTLIQPNKFKTICNEFIWLN